MRMLSLLTLSSHLASAALFTALAGTAAFAQEPPTTLKRMYSGTTVCTAENGTPCGTDFWSMYLHADGSRVIHIASETARAGEVRHATIVVDADGIPGEAFMHNRSKTEALGSSYVLQTQTGVDQTIHNDTGLKAETDALSVSSTASDKPESMRSIGTGPIVADGLHFYNYDVDKGGEQPHEVFWMGGSYGGTMAGGFRPTTYTFLGEEAIAMPQGYNITTNHFRMSSGSELWLTQDSRIVVRADVRFGPSPVLRYELKELKVTPIGVK